jgi:AraC-like DNA-binding protein
MTHDIPILVGDELGERELAIVRAPVTTYPIHGHACFEILIYEPFAGEITVNGKKTDARSPTAILLTPSDLHSTTLLKDEGAHCFKIQIRHAAVERFSRFVLHGVITQEPSRVSFLHALCAEAMAQREDGDYLQRCVELVVLTLQKSTEKHAIVGKSVALIRSATDVILQRFQEPLTLESVAAELHVSPQHLSALFSRFAGMSFVAYLAERRLAFAVGAMQNGANVTEACFLSGYRNLSHFIRSFKKKYGATPSKFMRQNG